MLCCFLTVSPYTRDPDCLDRTKWISQGILGQILEDIRNKFKDADRCHSQPATILTVNQPITHVQHEAASSGIIPDHPEYTVSTASGTHTSGPETSDDPQGKNIEVA